MNSEFSMLVSVCITILSFIIFAMLVHKYTRNSNKKYMVHSLTKLLIALTFFIFIDGLYYSVLYASMLRLLPVGMFMVMSSTFMELIPKVGIFISVVLVVHFIISKRIDEIKTKEESIEKLEKLNRELETKAKGLEGNQEMLEKKVKELERFTEIAKSRETEMVALIDKIEILEKKLKSRK